LRKQRRVESTATTKVDTSATKKVAGHTKELGDDNDAFAFGAVWNRVLATMVIPWVASVFPTPVKSFNR
jgi:hypothetical protein